MNFSTDPRINIYKVVNGFLLNNVINMKLFIHPHHTLFWADFYIQKINLKIFIDY